VKKNKFNKALRHLKSTELDEKIQKLDESPTNSIGGVYALNKPGFRLSREKDPEKVFYPDADGNWPSGIPGTPGEPNYVRPAGYWDEGPGTAAANPYDTLFTADWSYSIQEGNPRNTETLIDPDTGYVLSDLPPDSRSFILGPLVDLYFHNHSSDNRTFVGYVQKDTREFVLLGRVDGRWGNDNDGNLINQDGFETGRIWNGLESSFTASNSNFTFEMLQWFHDKLKAGQYVKRAAFFNSGGTPIVSGTGGEGQPDGTVQGNAVGAGAGDASDNGDANVGAGIGGSPDIGSPQDDPNHGDPTDAGFPWGLFHDLKSLLFGEKKKKPGEKYGPAFGDDKTANRERDKYVRELEDRMDEYGDDPKVKKAVEDWNNGLHNAGGGDAAETTGQTRDEVIQQGRENLSLPRTKYFPKDFDHDYEYEYYKLGGGDAAVRQGKSKKSVQVQGQTNVRMDGHWMNPNSWKKDPEKAFTNLLNDAMMVGPGGGSNAIRFAQTTRALRAVQGINGLKNTSNIIKNIPGRYTFLRGSGAPRPPKFSEKSREVWNTVTGKFETITPKDGIRWDWSQRTLSDDLFKHYTKTGEMPSGLDGWNVAKAFTPSMMRTGPTPNAAKGVGALVGGGVVAGSELGAPRPAKGSTSTQSGSSEKQISKPESISDIETILNTSELPNTEPNQEVYPEYVYTVAVNNLANAKEMGGAWTTGRLSGMSLGQIDKFFAGTTVDTNRIHSDINRIQSLNKRIARLGASNTMRSYDAMVALSTERTNLYNNVEANLSGSSSYVKPVIEPPKNPEDPQVEKNIEASLKQLEIDNEELKGEKLRRNLAFAADLGLDVLTVVTLLSPIPGDEAAALSAQAAKAGIKTGAKTAAQKAAIKKAKKDAIWKSYGSPSPTGRPGISKGRGMGDRWEGPLSNSYELEGKVLTESRKRILREIKQPYKMKETPKQKYKMNFKGKFTAQNTPDVTASKKSDEVVTAKNAAGQTWRTKDKYWSGYESTERMNVIYDHVGHGQLYWDTIVDENRNKKNMRDREIQEHLNLIDHNRAMKEIIEQQTLDAPKDPLFKKVANRLKTQIDYPDKPSKNGYPNDPPPEMVNGFHPDYGKRYKYDKLDPHSAEAMPPTGNPEVDANIKKATNQKEKARKLKKILGKKG